VAIYPYIAETAACVAVVILLATVIHLVVERPTMRLSEGIAHKAALPQTGLLDPTPQEAASQ
jgi:peptidoglycan/LPS O-acetylase OafA/YrhL